MTSLTHLIWIAIASGLSFVIAMLFAGRLQLQRNIYLLAYIPIIVLFVALYYNWNSIDLWRQFTTHWELGLIGAAITSIISVRHVLIQTSSPRRVGIALILDLLWPGFLYGLTDAMLLSVLPVTIVYHTFSELALITIIGQIGLSALGLLASLIVALCYHLGYPEYRGRQVLMTVVGNGIMTVAFLITGNPLAAIIPHCAMHIAAMWHGRETTYQLPPHYVEIPSIA